MVLALGMADFSLHSLSHKHADAHDSYHLEHEHAFKTPAGVTKIFQAEQECLRCGQFLAHTFWAVADLVHVYSLEYAQTAVLFFNSQLISNKLPSFFLRGPPKA